MAEGIMRPDIREHFAHSSDADFAYGMQGVGRFRVNAFRQRGSVAMIFRLVRSSTATFDQLGLPEVVGRLALEHRGLVLVTGPTGSGKTTTLAAMIDHINRTRECHIITIEDPIEVLHNDRMASINQREIGVDAASFASSMRAAMRQDPDVILVGEMRDEETVAAALSAAETGHLVLSTLHTIDATETIHRIVDFFPPHQQQQIRMALAGSLKGTICQRLVPRADGEGRVPALEVMVNNGRIQQCIADPELTGEIHEIVADGEYYGMQTFDQALVKLIELGHIDLRGAMATASRPHDLKVMLQQRGLVSAGRPVAVTNVS
jgi:twitching motility protein PilT